MIVSYNGSRKTRGFTLTEVAIVMGVVGLILGGIWIAAAAVYTNHRVNTAYTQVMKIAQGVRALMATKPQFNCDAPSMCDRNIVPDLKAAGVIPKDMWDPDNADRGRNPWGSAAFVFSTTQGNGFLIHYSRMPQDGCIQLISKVAGPGHDLNLYTKQGQATLALPTDSEDLGGMRGMIGNLITDEGVNPTPDATGCTSTSSTGNRVTFVFRL